MIMFSILLKREPLLAKQEFVDYPCEFHAALFMSVPVVKEDGAPLRLAARAASRAAGHAAGQV